MTFLGHRSGGRIDHQALFYVRLVRGRRRMSYATVTRTRVKGEAGMVDGSSHGRLDESFSALERLAQLKEKGF
jgi:hypothetical protein